ncbi:MAG: hypothetical protein SGARI_003370 [Bacillariaceae sp.]
MATSSETDAKLNGVTPKPLATLTHRATGSRELTIMNEDHHIQKSQISNTNNNNNNTIQNNPRRLTKLLLAKRDRSHYISTLAAGVGSGALASVICAPLDLMRTRMQVWGDISGQQTTRQAFQQILQKEGWKGMFRGLGATLVTVPLFWGVYFPLYDETKYYVSTNYPDYHPSVVHMGSAVFTGAVADVICNPCFVRLGWYKQPKSCMQHTEFPYSGEA